jgi:hypothetical protein
MHTRMHTTLGRKSLGLEKKTHLVGFAFLFKFVFFAQLFVLGSLRYQIAHARHLSKEKLWKPCSSFVCRPLSRMFCIKNKQMGPKSFTAWILKEGMLPKTSTRGDSPSTAFCIQILPWPWDTFHTHTRLHRLQISTSSPHSSDTRVPFTGKANVPGPHSSSARQ